MNRVAEGLVLAVRSLPKEDKTKIISNLLDDTDVMEVIAELVVKKLVSPKAQHEEKYSPNTGNFPGTSDTSRERGSRIRERYVLELVQKGMQINQVDNVWAKTPARWVGIPFASERRPNRWFLGLPENEVLERIHNEGVVLVLLCQPMSGPVLDFVFPSGKFQEIVNLLSKSKGQLKFNVKRVSNRYYLVLPRRGTLDISDYKGSLSVLKR